METLYSPAPIDPAHLERLEAELAKTKAELAKVKKAAAEVCLASVGLADQDAALRKLGDAIDYPGYWELRWESSEVAG